MEVEPSPEAAPPKPAGKRLGKRAIILLAALSVVLLVIAGTAIWFLLPNRPNEYQDAVSFEQRNANTLLYAAVRTAGVDNPYVEVAEGRAFIAYDWEQSRANSSWIALTYNVSESHPRVANDTESLDDMQRILIGAAASAVPDAQRIEVVQVDHNDHGQAWKVEMADVLAFFRGDLSADAFEAKIVKGTWPA